MSSLDQSENQLVLPFALNVPAPANNPLQLLELERALKQSELRYNTLVELCPHPFLIVSGDVYVFANQAAAKLMGLESTQDIVGRPLLENVHPSFHHKILQQVNDAKLAQDNTAPVDLQIVRADGHIVDVEALAATIPYDNKVAVQLILSDITARKRAECDLRSSEFRYRSLFNRMSEGISVCEVIFSEDGEPSDLRIVDVNAVVLRRTGLKPSDLIGQRVLKLLPDLSPDLIRSLGQISLDGIPLHFEYFSKTFTRYFEVFAYTPIAGQIAIITLDISMRKRAEEALRLDQERLRIAIDSTELGTIDIDLKNWVIECSGSARRSLGLPSHGEIHYNQALKSVHPADRRILDRQVKMILRRIGNGLGAAEFRTYGIKDGKLRWVHVSGRIVFDSHQVPVRFTGTTLEITEQKRAEQERQISLEFLELISNSSSTRKLLPAVISFFEKHSGCELVGLRLSSRHDYPFTCSASLNEQFTRAENGLWSVDCQGHIMSDDSDLPHPGCICGRVIYGDLPDVATATTKHGTFWTCDINTLKATLKGELNSPLLGNCMKAGYQSVAFIPLRAGQKRLGLLQLADKRPGRFAIDSINLWEELTTHLSSMMERFETERALRSIETRLKMLHENSRDVVYERNFQTGRCDYLTPSIEELTGFSVDEALKSPLDKIISRIHPEDRATANQHIKKAILGRQTSGVVEYRFLHKNDTYRWFSDQFRIRRDEKGRPVALTGNFRDVTDAKSAEAALNDLSASKRAQQMLERAHLQLEAIVTERTAELSRANQTLRIISECTRALIHANDEKALIWTLCEHIHRIGGYPVVWAAKMEKTEPPSLRPLAVIGRGFLKPIRLAQTRYGFANTPTLTSLSTGKIYINNNIGSAPKPSRWQKTALSQKLHSCISLPLVTDGIPFASLTLYAKEPGAFCQDQVTLLQDLVQHLAVGIVALRARKERD